MLQNFNLIIYYLGSVTFIAPLILVFLKRRIFFSPLTFYIFISFLSVIFSYIFSVYFSNAYPVFHFTILLNCTSLLWYFKSQDISYGKVYIALIILLVLFSISDLNSNGLWKNNFQTSIFSNVCLTMVSLRYLYLVLNDNSVDDIFHFESRFYIAFSIFILNATSFFFSILENQIRSELSEVFLVTFPLYMLFNMLHNLFITLGIWKQTS